MAPLMTGFNAINAPNGKLCFGGDESTVGTLTSSSLHPGGVHVAMGDASVQFVTDSVETFSDGDAGFDPATGVVAFDPGTVVADGTGPRAPGSPSRFGVWGESATRAGGEVRRSLWW